MREGRSGKTDRRGSGKTRKRGLYPVAFLCLCLALAGCVSTSPARLYTLNPVTPGGGTDGRTFTNGPCIAISAVEIPDYLERPYLVTRDSQNGVQYSVLDRWAGSLQEDVVRVLAEDLSSRLDSVTVLTGRRPHPVDYWMKVSLRRFDPVWGDKVQLNAVWGVFGKDGKELLVRQESTLTEPVKGEGHTAIVAAMSRALGALSDRMADRLRAVIPVPNRTH